ncbi:MAG: tetratricopeptide repeat protein [Paludibacteraceae bacterium]|nr:tetratricopeptide repeat protein [Bacteroidales bacterium]MDY4149610.1 tetratricopeptide repeat protein [Paludibacteraceae bacterium]
MTFPSLLYIIIAACVLLALFVAVIVLTDQLRHVRSENATLRSHLGGLEDRAQRDKQNKRDEPRTHTGMEILEGFAKISGCQLVTENQDDDDIQYSFVYQGGNFYSIASKHIGDIQLFFFGAYSLPYSLDNLQWVQEVCERQNRQYKFGKATFSYDAEDSQLSLNIEVDCVSPDASILRRYIGLCFAMANDIREAFKTPRQFTEKDTINENHKRQLLLEAELYHQRQPRRISLAHRLPAGDLSFILLAFFSDEEQVEDLLALTIVRDNTTEQIRQRDKIAHFNVLSTMIDGEGEQAQMRTSPAVLSLETTYRHYTLVLHPVSDLQGTIYLRLTAVCVPYDNLQYEMPEGTYNPQAISVLLTYDRNTDATTERYRLREELAKEPANPYTFFQYGYQLYSEQHFVDALGVLLPLFRHLKPDYFGFNDDQKKLFFDIAYYIGFCYTELQRYDLAYYYLELVCRLNRFDYSAEYINCLANGSDIRVFKEVGRERDEISKLIEEVQNAEDSDSEENIGHYNALINYYAFLQRRIGYALIEFQQYDEAEQHFQKMLEQDPDNDYAQNELNYIAQLRRRSQHSAEDNADDNHTDNPSNTTDNDNTDSEDKANDK